MSGQIVKAKKIWMHTKDGMVKVVVTVRSILGTGPTRILKVGVESATRTLNSGSGEEDVKLRYA